MVRRFQAPAEGHWDIKKLIPMFRHCITCLETSLACRIQFQNIVTVVNTRLRMPSAPSLINERPVPYVNHGIGCKRTSYPWMQDRCCVGVAFLHFWGIRAKHPSRARACHGLQRDPKHWWWAFCLGCPAAYVRVVTTSKLLMWLSSLLWLREQVGSLSFIGLFVHALPASSNTKLFIKKPSGLLSKIGRKSHEKIVQDPTTNPTMVWWLINSEFGTRLISFEWFLHPKRCFTKFQEAPF